MTSEFKTKPHNFGSSRYMTAVESEFSAKVNRELHTKMKSEDFARQVKKLFESGIPKASDK